MKLEKDFELLDTADAGNCKDEEIDQMPGSLPSLMKVITKNQDGVDAIKKLVADKKKAGRRDQGENSGGGRQKVKSEESAMMIHNTIIPNLVIPQKISNRIQLGGKISQNLRTHARLNQTKTNGLHYSSFPN